MDTIFGITQETVVNDITKPYAGYSQENPDVAVVDSTGDFVVVWDGINDVSGSFPTYAIYGQSFDSLPASPSNSPATKLGGEFQINVEDYDNQSRVSVAAGGTGTFIAAWDSYFQDTDVEYGVYARRYSSISSIPTSDTSDVRINTTTNSNQQTPSIAMDSDGNYVVVWQGQGTPFSDDNDIYIQRFNSSGGVLLEETKVNTSAVGILEFSPIVAMNATGTFVVVWTEQNASGDDNVFFALYGNNGDVVKGPTQVNQTSSNAQNNPSVAISNNGEFAIVWQSAQGGTTDIYARKFNSVGNPALGATGNEFLVHASTAGEQVAPDVDIDDNGNFVVAWQDSNAEETGTDGIYARRFISTGADGDAVRVNETTKGNQIQPAIAMKGTGDFVVAWVSDQVTPSEKNIYARQFIINDAPTDLNLSKTDVDENLPVNAVVGNIIGIDPDLPYDTLTYSLVSGTGSADNASFNVIGNQLRLNISPNFEAKSSYNIRLRVTDQGTLTQEKAFVITINDVNEAPTDVTFSNQTISIAENIDTTTRIEIADVNVLDDALGSETLTLSGADAAFFEIDAGIIYLKANTVLNFEAKANYGVTVNVDDPTVGVNPDVSRVLNLSLIDINEAPTAVNLTNTVTTIAENANTSSAIKVADIDVADDALGTETLSLSGADADSFIISGNGLYLKSGTLLDFETKSIYNVTVNVDDPTVGTTPDVSTNFTLTVTDVNEAPTAASLVNTITTIAENTSTASRIKVADVNVIDDALGTETLTLSGTDASFFEIDAGVLYLKAGTTLNFEAKATYNVTVNVDDSTVGSTPDFALPFTLTLTDVNEAPTAVNFANTTSAIAENTSTATRIKVADINLTDDALGTESLTLSGADAGFFEIDANVLYLKAGTTLDFETKTTYNVTVNADDSTVGGTPDVSNNFTLTITDVNEAPTAASLDNTTTTIAENTDTTSRIKVADISITDDALGTENLTLSGTDASFFEIDAGVLYLKAGTTLDFENKPAYNITVNVDDVTVGSTPDFALPFTLTLTDVNEAPTAASLINTTTTIAENTDTTSRIKVADISITDDALGTEDLTLSGTDASFFEIDAGALYLKADTTLDFETQSSYNVTVSVDDATVGSTPDLTLPFTLTLTDENEAPTAVNLVNTTTTLAENTSTASRIKMADITVTDVDAGTNTLSLSGADAAFFEISAGVLYLRAGTTLDYETQSSYNITVNVDDATVGSTPDASNTFTLTLTDENEAPTAVNFANTITTIAENTTIASRIKVADISISDDVLGTENLSLSGTDANFFEIDAGVLYLKAGTSLDYETQFTYNVVVDVEDTTVGSTPDASNTFTLTVENANDPAIIGGTSTGSVTEDSTLTATGILSVADQDNGESNFIVQTNTAGTHGTFSIDTAGAWSYTANNATLQALGRGQSAIDRFDVASADGTIHTITLTANGVNDAPIVTVAIADQVVQHKQPFTLTLPTNSFTDVDGGDRLTLSATLADGSSLPNWLSFDASTYAFSGIADFPNASSLEVKVTATDSQGAITSDTFILAVDPLTGVLGTPTPPIRFNQQLSGVNEVGTPGADALLGTWRNDVLRGGDGNDILRSGFAQALFGQDKLYGEGGNDLLYGGRGKDLLDGGQGNDRLIGGNKRDLLKGGDGRDRLLGGKGNDILVGGNGNDVLTGNQGRDTFVFNKLLEAVDVITDFTSDDLIDLRSLLTQPQFAAVSAFAKFTQFVQLQQVGADTQLQIDTDGTGVGTATTTLAVLTNVTVSSVTSTQFLIKN
jgi:VCBS repeat-containing protein